MAKKTFLWLNGESTEVAEVVGSIHTWNSEIFSVDSSTVSTQLLLHMKPYF